MSSERQFEFTKDNIDLYLKELSKEYRKQAGKAMPWNPWKGSCSEGW